MSSRSSDTKGEDSAHRKMSTLNQRISHFTWSWFTCTMSTSSVAVLLSQQPHAFNGLQTIGTIFFIAAVVLFVLFNAMITYRFVRQPRLFTISLHHPSEALFFGSWWVTIALLLISTQEYGVPFCGPWLTRFLEVAFWLYTGFASIVAIFQYTSFFSSEQLPVSSAMPAWVFPVYPFLLVGPLASLIIPGQSRASALLILIGGYTMQGLAWTVSLFVYTIYIIRMMQHGPPPPPIRPGAFISVGPAAYTSLALISLGNQATHVIPAGFMSITNTNVGSVIKITSVMAGIFVWMVGFWFFGLSLVSVVMGVKKMKFTIHWWAFIFPNVGLTTAVIQIGNVLNSNGIKWVGSVLTIIIVAVWFLTALGFIYAIIKKQVLWEGQDEDVGEEEKLVEKLKNEKGGGESHDFQGEATHQYDRNGPTGPMDRYLQRNSNVA